MALGFSQKNIVVDKLLIQKYHCNPLPAVSMAYVCCNEYACHEFEWNRWALLCNGTAQWVV